MAAPSKTDSPRKVVTVELDYTPLIEAIGTYITEKRRWAVFAKCHLDRQPTAFFLFATTASPRHARRVADYCADCEVRVDCLEYGLADPSAFGYYGGLPIGDVARHRQEAADVLVSLRSR